MNAVFPIVTVCPACQARFRVSAEHEGKTAKCPSCRQPFVVKAENDDHKNVLDDGLPTGLIGVNCLLCGTRLYGHRWELGKLLRCPDCGSQTKLPPPAKRPGPVIPQALLGEQYELWEGEDQPWGIHLAAEQKRLIPVRCELCATLMYAPPEQLGGQIECPDCGRSNTVRPASLAPPTGPQPVGDDEEYQLDDPALASSVVPTALPPIYAHLYETESHRPNEDREKQIRLAATDRRARPQISQWPLVTGYVAFVSGPGVVARWIAISVALLAAIALGVFAWSLLWNGYAALAGLPLLCVAASVAALAYGAAAACAVLIVAESSEGNDHIAPWPSANPMDWLGEAIYVLVALSAAAIPGWTVAKLAGGDSFDLAAAMLASAWLCFPLTLLSQLEASSAMALVMPGVLASIRERPASWALFYLLSGLGAAAVVATVLLLALPRNPAVLLLAVPIAVGALGLYFRLLGRLAWRIRQ